MLCGKGVLSLHYGRGVTATWDGRHRSVGGASLLRERSVTATWEGREHGMG